MIFGGQQTTTPIEGGELAQAIATRPTPAGEYLGAVTAQSFETSTPGLMAAEVQMPDDDLTGRMLPGVGAQILQGKIKAPVTRDDYLALMEKSQVPVMTKDQWQASPFYREAIPFDQRMTTQRAKAKAEIYDEDQRRNWLRQNRPAGVGTTGLAILGGLAGSLPDPTNYIPIFGAAFKAASAGRIANILRRGGMSALDAAAMTAITEPMIVSSRRQYGDDITFAQSLTDIALGAAVGGLFGGFHGAVERIPAYHPARVQAALNTLGEGANQVALGQPLDLGRVFGEMQSTRDRLLGGTALSPSARYAGTPDSSSGLASGLSRNLSQRPDGFQAEASRSNVASSAPPSGVFDSLNRMPSQERVSPSLKSNMASSPSNGKVYHNINDVNTLQKLSEELAPKLTQWLQGVVGNIPGVKVYGARPKATPRIMEKIAEGKQPQGISDYLGGRIVVDDFKALHETVRRISSRADVRIVEDFVNDGNASGYRAVHLQVNTTEGLSYELQIQPREIRDVQDRAHEVYSKWRALPDESRLAPDKYQELVSDNAGAIKLFADAWDAFRMRAGERPEGEPPYGRAFNTTMTPERPLNAQAALDAADAAVGKPVPVEKLAQDHGLDDLAEIDAQVKELAARGAITADETKALKAADDVMKKADDYAKAYEAAAICLGRA